MSEEPRSDMVLQPSCVLASLVEPWAKGRRVALVGDASLAEESSLAEALAERGARFVQVLDPRLGQGLVSVAPSLQGRVAVAPYGAEVLAQPPREGFDLAIVADLSMFEDPKAECARVRRLLVPGGLLVAATPNREAKARLAPAGEGRKLDYYELYDALAPLFRHVRTFGQAPFVGYTLADFGAGGEPEVSVDTSLLAGPEEPEWFVAVASDRGLGDAAEFAIVELAAAALGARDARDTGGADRVALGEAQARIAALTTQLEAARDRERVKSRELEQRTAELGATAAQLEEARRDARGAKHEERAVRAEAERDRAKKRLEDAEREATRLHEQLEITGTQKLAAEAASADSRTKEAALRTELGAERARRDALVAKNAELEALLQVAKSAPRPDDLEAERARDVGDLEAALRERGQAMTELRRELREAERFARELLLDLEELRAAAAAGAPGGSGGGGGGGRLVVPSEDALRAADLAARLDALATEAARREADYHAASWRVRTLERELGELRLSSEASSRAASEQAVLLAQVAGAALAGAP